MRTKNGKQFWVFDNLGETLDRYTIITFDGDVYSASENPFIGFGQFSFNICDKYATSYGIDWRKRLNVDKITKSEIKEYLRELKRPKNSLGKEIKSVKHLPEKLVNYINDINIEF